LTVAAFAVVPSLKTVGALLEEAVHAFLGRRKDPIGVFGLPAMTVR